MSCDPCFDARQRQAQSAGEALEALHRADGVDVVCDVARLGAGTYADFDAGDGAVAVVRVVDLDRGALQARVVDDRDVAQVGR
jgi:hypothetical protein